jgi:hypothetical protein
MDDFDSRNVFIHAAVAQVYYSRGGLGVGASVGWAMAFSYTVVSTMTRLNSVFFTAFMVTAASTVVLSSLD